MKDTYDEELQKAIDDIMKTRNDLAKKAIAREKQEKKEKNIFYKIVKKLLTLFK